MIFLYNSLNASRGKRYMCSNHGRRKDFFQWGAKSGEIWFLPLEIEETTFFC